MGADTVAGLWVGSCLGARAMRPARYVGGAVPFEASSSPAHKITRAERFGVSMVAGESRQLSRCHFPNTDDPMTALDRAGQTSEVLWRHVECLDHRSLLIGEGHERPPKADTTRDPGRAAARPSIGAARTMSRIPNSRPLWTRMPRTGAEGATGCPRRRDPRAGWAGRIAEERRNTPSRTTSARSWPGDQPILRAGPRRGRRPWASIVETWRSASLPSIQ